MTAGRVRGPTHPRSWTRPVLVPNTHKCWTQHHKLQSFPHSLSPCPHAQQSHKKWHFISRDSSWPLPRLGYHLLLPLQQQLNSFYAKLVPGLGLCTWSSFTCKFFLKTLSWLASASQSVSTLTMTPCLHKPTSVTSLPSVIVFTGLSTSWTSC